MFTKSFMAGGRGFSMRKINPRKCLPGILSAGNLPPSPKEKKRKKRKLTPENIIS